MNCLVLGQIICWYAFNGGSVSTAMQTLMEQTADYARPQIIYNSADGRREASPCSGMMRFAEALTCVLRGTGLTWVQYNERSYTLVHGVESAADRTTKPYLNPPLADWN